IVVFHLQHYVRDRLEKLRWRKSSGGAWRGGVEVGFDQGAQLAGDLRRLSEPQRKAADSLMQKHAKPVSGGKPACLCSGKQRGDDRDVDDIGDGRMTVEAAHIEREHWLPVHPERRGVDKERGIREL